jgi:hypothetical protein
MLYNTSICSNSLRTVVNFIRLKCRAAIDLALARRPTPKAIMGDQLSGRSIHVLLDLIGARIRDIDSADRKGMHDLQTLEQCRQELETLKAAAEVPQDVMRRARLAGIM